MAKRVGIEEYRLTQHARSQMARRQVTESDVARVLAAPEQTEEVRKGRVVYQSRMAFGEPSKSGLLRVFVDIDREPPEVVTVYRTSRIAKYWRDEP